MIESVSIKKSIYSLLKTTFGFPVYLDEVIEAMEKPCFFIELESENTISSPELMFRELTITITYYQAEPSELDKMQVQSILINLFSPILEIRNRFYQRKLTPKAMSGTTYGNLVDVMEFVIFADFYDKIDSYGESEELMENVEFNTTNKEGD